MEKIKSILASASGKKPGPPVPPRPSPAAVQKALEKTLQQSPTLQPAQGRTVIYTSSCVLEKQARPIDVSRGTKCFDTKRDESSTGLSAINGNGASRVLEGDKATFVSGNVAVRPDNAPMRVILHHKSPVPRPRSVNPDKPGPEAGIGAKSSPKVSTVLLNQPAPVEAGYQRNSYANLLARNQNFPPPPRDATVKVNHLGQNRDDELKEKLLNEMLNRSQPVEAANRHVKYNPSTGLKRSSSFDMLNELGEGVADKKAIFHEILISELSEMRLSSAKSSPDISPSGATKFFEADERRSYNAFVSLEDSGVEDEGKMDDCSSGVGDSWDSCKEMENR